MEIKTLVNTIRDTPDCVVIDPPHGLPSINPGHLLPTDVRVFYELCGGVTLFEHAECPMDIVPPEKFVVANPVILLGLSEEQLESTKHELSWSWYIVGEGNSGEWICIDLAPERLGRCYYSFWDCHAMKGCSPIIATSFTDLLAGLLADQGQEFYWERSDFESLGDAYDGLEDG